MQAIGILMIEHRLTERMLRQMDKGVERMRSERRADIAFVREIIDFIETYIDRMHHGKEERVLFAALDKKALTDEHRRIMNELVDEHDHARELLSALKGAADRYAGGDPSALGGIEGSIAALASFYPKHIDKEDHHFFFPVMYYLSADEKDSLVGDSFEFDQKILHDLYRERLEAMEDAYGATPAESRMRA